MIFVCYMGVSLCKISVKCTIKICTSCYLYFNTNVYQKEAILLFTLRELLSNINAGFSSSTRVVWIISSKPLFPTSSLFPTPNYSTSSECLYSFPWNVSFTISIVTGLKLKCTKISIILPCQGDHHLPSYTGPQYSCF